MEWVETVETSLLVTILKISTHFWPLKHMKNQHKDLKVSVAFKCSRFNMIHQEILNALQEPPPQVPSVLLVTYDWGDIPTVTLGGPHWSI